MLKDFNLRVRPAQRMVVTRRDAFTAHPSRVQLAGTLVLDESRPSTIAYSDTCKVANPGPPALIVRNEKSHGGWLATAAWMELPECLKLAFRANPIGA